MSTTVSGPAWDLTAEYDSVDDVRLTQDLAELNGVLDRIEALNKSLTDESVAVAQDIHRLSEEASSLLSNVSTYANCMLWVDGQDDGAQKLNRDLHN